MAPATTKRTSVIIQSARHFCPIATKFGVTQQIFIKVLSIKFYGNYFCGELRWYVQTDGRERSKHTLFAPVRTRLQMTKRERNVQSRCVSLLNFRWNLLPVNRTAILCADTHSSLPLGQTPVNATRATPAKRVRSSNTLTRWPTYPRRYKTSEHRCAHNIVRSMARSLGIECSPHQKFRKNRWSGR